MYPDGSRDRVEYNQFAGGATDRAASRPVGMAADNQFLTFRNTYYWSRTACATGYGDYTKARLYHWLHTADGTTTSGILESAREAMEGRVWYNYAGQSSGFGSVFVGNNNLPTHMGRVLDDGQTQLYTYAYNGLGNLTNSIDPVGRTFGYTYDTNGIDLLEIRQTRAGNNELLARMTYNAHHRPLTRTDAAGQTTTYTYNARGQLLTATDPKNETVIYTYDTNGYLLAADGPLPGANDVVTATYDVYGRIRTMTDVSGYTLIFDYDDLDRVARITHPDSTFSQYTYDRLDLVGIRDRAGRHTLFEYDNMRRLTEKSDPLGRVTRFEWCRCRALKSLTDPMGRTTSWLTHVQGRRTAKQYGDGSQVKYLYETASSRLRQVIDEKHQVSQFTYNPDNTLHSTAYANTAVPTPSVSYTYDPNYRRRTSMTDGVGTTLYAFAPVTPLSVLGAGRLASVDGPLPNATITYEYDELGRRTQTAINGVAMLAAFDAAGRVITQTNALGSFRSAYDGISRRLVSQSFPNGQTVAITYGGPLQDFTLQQISYAAGATPISQFLYGHDIPAQRITNWSQQAGTQPPSVFSLGYDAANQLLSATVTKADTLVNTFAYAYDPAGNRLTEQVGASNYTATYNAMNQISTTTAPGASRTNEWDAVNRLAAVNSGNQRTEFTYDGFSRMVGIRQLLNGSEVSRRRFVWSGRTMCEERDATGVVTKRFFAQGMRVESGPVSGTFFYTRDHLGSIRELTDGSGNVRARYAYDPYGRRIRLTGDVEADFGFAGMFWAAEANLLLTHYRAYDPELGRWLSRDPLRNAEMKAGQNLYAYVGNGPVNNIDPEGLISTLDLCGKEPGLCAAIAGAAEQVVEHGGEAVEAVAPALEGAGEACLQAVEGRIGDLLERTMDIAPDLANYRFDIWSEATDRFAQVGELFSVSPIAPSYLFELEAEFQELAWALVERWSVSGEDPLALFSEASQMLSLLLRWNPATW